MVSRYAFLVDVPDEDNHKEYETVGDDLDAETAIERCYDQMPRGSTIVKVLRGDVRGDVDLTPAPYAGTDESDDGDETTYPAANPEAGTDESEREEGADGDESEPDDPHALPNPGDETIDSLDEKLEEGDFSEHQLEAILDAEKEGKDRHGGKATIEAYMEGDA